MPHHPVDPTHRKRARAMRRDMTDAERRLWHQLKAHRFEGLHFRRQVPMGPYIADFVCHGAKLIIEVDGGQHNEDNELRRDKRRTAWLQSTGYRVLRFWNVDVLTNMEGVIDAIGAEVFGNVQAAAAPLPRPGGGQGGGLSTAQMPVGCILAGGQSRRMGGGDKGLLTLAGKPILDHVIARLKPQAHTIIVNANSNAFAHYGLPVIADGIPNFAGPLAGILACLEWAMATSASRIVSVPTDTPFLPADLVARLEHACQDHDIACAASGGRTHPVIALWQVSLIEDLHRALTAEGLRKVDALTRRYRTGIAEWPAEPYDPFFNINRPEDLDAAERIANEFFP